MVRVITQETYNEVVNENIEDFDMTPEDAIKDAIAQFEAQGVDLSNIIKDLTLSGDILSTAVGKLKRFNAAYTSDDDLTKVLEVLKTECSKDIARRVKAGKDGAYTALVDLLQAKQEICIQNASEDDAEVIIKLLDCLVALMDTQPDLLDGKGIGLMKNLLENTHNNDILSATLKWTSMCCTKHEMNRQNLFANNIGDDLKIILGNKSRKVLSECLQVIRKFTLDDDIRVEFGKTHDHAKELGMSLLVPLTNLLKENTKPPLVSELMLTIASLLVRHELCQTVAQCGLDMLLTILASNYDSCSVVQQANKLITALAGNDDVKKDLVKSGVVPMIVTVLSRHSNNATAAAVTLKCIAMLTLREPSHSIQFIENDAPNAMIDCMKQHPDIASVQKNGCWAIRNMVARCRDHNIKFHDLGVQDILNSAYDKFGDQFGFDIKSALRDLECDVKLDEQWTGKGVQLDS